ncbi:glycosyltransferase family 2 protein [Francisella opportunistica]|uniref:Glycosyltransferase family 2 protein n=1 Tax=Francisella opportunistica TaxID=2016517 RepID=A0A345JQP7_9GAMM|nr:MULTISPECIES: glycosyltransferase family 2 protein [Francisella]APC91350.1 Beta-1,3-glucosyltransferase [Francisella sp. MA067296]AXH29643.1 glycosyltransferase family 2 protein [Francisella opportunistica]AXH31293.1 glycosyltransferase family 2 protein [Francisella opportunistica]AXH32940.1 glycosyltransferase family 2 protein [Francisella opportunistica]
MSQLISIIIPIYNTQEYLSRCLESVINQTYKNLEIILINDGSTDSSLSICEKYKSKDNRIVLLNQQNSGQALARNSALDMAKGDYIAFIDSDDWVSLDYIQALYNHVFSYSADISISATVGCNKQIKAAKIILNIISIFDNNNSIMKAFLSKKLSSMACGSLISRKLIDNYRFRNFIAYEDLDFFYKIYSQAQVIVKDNNVRYFYYQRDDGIMGTNRLNFSLQHLQALKSVITDYESFFIEKYSQFGGLIYMNILRHLVDNFSEAAARKNILANDILALYKTLYLNCISRGFKLSLPYKLFFYFPNLVAKCYLKAKKIKLSLKEKKNY